MSNRKNQRRNARYGRKPDALHRMGVAGLYCNDSAATNIDDVIARMDREEEQQKMKEAEIEVDLKLALEEEQYFQYLEVLAARAKGKPIDQAARRRMRKQEPGRTNQPNGKRGFYSPLMQSRQAASADTPTDGEQNDKAKED